jgi:hypothetical protein
MNGDCDSTTRELVERTLHRYTHAVDSRDWTLLASCFTEDATVSYRGFNDHEGREAIVYGCRRSLIRFIETQHLIGESEITLSALDRDVSSTCDVMATHLRANDDGTTERFTLGGVYTDWLVPGDGALLIAHRVLDVTWESGDSQAMRWP